MTSLSELQQRVVDAGDRLKVIDNERRKRAKQLSHLMRAIEVEVVRKERLVKSLCEELAGAQEDHRQLRGMLDSLLAATEQARESELKIRTHINHYIETVSSLDFAPDVGDVEPDRASEGRNAHLAQGATFAKSSPIARGAVGEEDKPLELTQMIVEDGSVVDLNAERTSESEAARKSIDTMRRRLATSGGKGRRPLWRGIKAKH